jgi:hypothetical protein
MKSEDIILILMPLKLPLGVSFYKLALILCHKFFGVGDTACRIRLLYIETLRSQPHEFHRS